MKSIFLGVNNSGLHYSASEFIPWTATNLPAASFRFRNRETYYWEVGMVRYDVNSATLRVEVLDFEPSPNNFDPNLKMKRPVKTILFGLLEEEAFKAQLSWYRAGALSNFLKPPTSFVKEPVSISLEEKASATPADFSRSVSFQFPLLQLTFTNGGVTGTVELPGLLAPIKFRISNDHLVAEFDHIKPFFVKALKRRTIQVSAILSFPEDQPEIIAAQSPQIDYINNDLLEIFRARALRNFLTSDKIKTVDKSLFTPADVFESLEEESLGKALLPKEPEDLLALLLEEKKVRNARQLTFLSGQLHQPGTKIRYVLSPGFGFVFLTIGQEANHFVLELLNSHATYIWSIPKFWKTLDDQYRAVEKEIKAINHLGRSQYRRSLHFEHGFWFVIHEAAESGITDGFPRWKNRLLEGIV